jgi:hypothetical protein
MITDKIKALFQFIEFLHSNIENFKQYDEVINELYFLDNKRSELKPRNNFNDKLKYDEVQTEIKDKFKVIKKNIISSLQAKATELNICDWNNPDETLWNYNISEVNSLKEKFGENDLPVILNYKRKYIEFRTTTNCTYFQDSFFSGLDEIFKELFDFFKDSEHNEFKAFEAKKIEVNSFNELAEIISGKSKLKIKIDKNLTITEKLNYWQNVIETNISEPLKKKYGNDFLFKFEAEQEQRKILTKLFGLKYNLVSPLLIPIHIYNEHFENGLNEPEFTYWFLKYNSQTFFEVEIIMKRLPEKLNTPLSENFINVELKKLNDFEIRAESLLHENKFDIYDEYSYSEYTKEIEYLRIKAEYYKTHALPSVHAIGNTTVVLYAEHILLKEFLENELKKVQPQNRLQLIKGAVVTNKWANSSLSQMRYNSTEIWHQVAGYHWEGETLYKNHSDIELDTVNFPVITKGFTAYLIQNFGKSEQLIFDKYYEHCLNRYKQEEARKPGSSMRDLDAEFYPLHISLEKEFAKFSELILPYLCKAEIELINQYIEAYFKYIEQKYSTKSTKKEILKYFPELNEQSQPEKKTKSNQKLKDGYSSKEWCTILYFTDYLEKHDTDYDTDVAKSFHAKHKLPFAETSFLQNFKDVKRHIEKSEKQAVRLIEKIIPYFSQDKAVSEYAENQLSIILDDLERK